MPGRIRMLVHMRGRWPVSYILPGVILGQLIVFIARPSPEAASIIIVFCLLLGLKTAVIRGAGTAVKAAGYFAGLAPGIISAALFCPKPTAPILDSTEPLLVEVDSDPRYRMPGRAEFSFKVLGVLASEGNGVRQVIPPIRILCKALDLPWRNSTEYEIGNIGVIRAALSPLEAGNWPWSYNATLLRHGYSYSCKIRYASAPIPVRRDIRGDFQRTVENKVHSILGNSERSGLLLSMALGKRDVISKDTEEAFKRAGLAHLLVVSGYQVTLVYYTVLGVALWAALRIPRAFRAGMILSYSSGIALGTAMLFVAAVGAESPSLRAGIAVLAVAVSRTLERGTGLLNAILISFLLIAVIWPGSYFEPSVQLTYAAIFGIALGTALRRRSMLMRYLESSFYATAASSLVALFWFEQVSLAGFILNPIVAPIASWLACNLGFLAVGLALTPLDPSGYLLQLVAFVLQIIRDMVVTAAEVPGAAFKLSSSPKMLAALMLGVLLWWRWRRVYREYRILNGIS